MTKPVAPERPGYVIGVNARAVGLVVTGLGGNRRREDDQIDYGVGLSRVAAIGTEVGPDCPLAIVHARGDSSADEAATALRAAIQRLAASRPPSAACCWAAYDARRSPSCTSTSRGRRRRR